MQKTKELKSKLKDTESGYCTKIVYCCTETAVQWNVPNCEVQVNEKLEE